MFRCFQIFVVIIFWQQIALTQNDFVVITQITIQGNDKTKPEAILREIDFSVNDTIALIKLATVLLENEKRLKSTGLFSEVNINLKNWNPDIKEVNVHILVKEGWYVYPYVIFELADRNFNVWAKEFDYSIQRLNYGIALTHINFTGGKDKFKAKLQFGFTGKYELYYEYPYFKNGWGFASNLFYSYNKEISYKTIENRPLFYKAEDERNLLSHIRGSFAITKRKSAFTFHTARLSYYYGKVDKEIPLRFNEDYFLYGNSILQFLRFEYEFVYNKLRYPLYPELGYFIKINFKKDGFGRSKSYNNTSVFAEYSKHWNFLKRFIYSTRIKIKGNLQRNRIPYLYTQALGYENDVVTGYQLYVIDGTDFALMNNSLKCNIFKKDFYFKKWVPKKLRPFSTQVFLRFNGDFSYVNEPFNKINNPLSNSFLYGFGPGLDIVFFHNMILSFDFSFNAQGESGFFAGGGFQF
jgi:outer membrane protein assembly factor BamA